MLCLLPSVLHLTTKIYFSLASLFLLISSTRRTSARVKVALFSLACCLVLCISLSRVFAFNTCQGWSPNQTTITLLNLTMKPSFTHICTPFCWNGVTICWFGDPFCCFGTTICWFGDPFCCFGTTRWEIWQLGVTKSWTSSRMLILKLTRNNKVSYFQI